jgi:hypothetical protein
VRRHGANFDYAALRPSEGVMLREANLHPPKRVGADRLVGDSIEAERIDMLPKRSATKA